MSGGVLSLSRLLLGCLGSGWGGRRLRRSSILHLLHQGEVEGIEPVQKDGGVSLELEAL